MNSRRGKLFSFAAMLFLFGVMFAQTAHAMIVPFTIFTNNGGYNDSSSVDIYMDVYNGENSCKFTFYNDSAVDCVITKIYFDDGTLLGIDWIDYSSGVYFEPAVGGPGNLPAGEMLIPDFVADREFNIGADNPSPTNGVNNGVDEWVTVQFDLQNGGTIEDILNELMSGELRVGIHIQSFPDGTSESAINEPIPEPATICLFALGGLALLRKRRA